MRYLLDSNVVRAMGPGGNKQVRAWIASVNDSELCISVLTIKEIQEGITREHMRSPSARTEQAQRALDALLAAYHDRIVAIDRRIAEEWGRLVGTKGKHNDDMALAATARVNKLVLVTRNIADFRGRGVDVLDPFKRTPQVVTV